MLIRFFLTLLVFAVFSAPAFAVNVAQQAFQDIETYLTDMDGLVVDIDNDNNVLIDLGAAKKALPGLKLNVFSEEKEIVHPVTGKTLGKKQESIGVLTVTKVENEYSVTFFDGSPGTSGGNKTDERRFPVKSGKVGINFPIKVTLFFDNGTDEDLQITKNMLAASNIYRESSDTDAYKLALRRTGNMVGYTLEQADGTVILSGNAMETEIPISDNMEPLLRVELPKGRYVSIAMGKIYRDDPALYMVGLVEDKIVVFDPSKNYAQIEAVQIKRSQLLNIETADLDGDGQDEIFVSNVVNGSEASSFVYKHDGKELKQIQKSIPWFFRSVRNADGSRRIIAQKLTNNGEYSGEIFYFKYDDGKYSEDAAIKGTLGKSLFGFSVYQSDKDELFLNIGKGSKFSISSFRKTEYNAPGYYGDTFHMLPVREKRSAGTRNSSMEADSMIEYLDKRVFITPRIEIVDEERFAVVQNDLYARVFTASPVFSESAILLYAYKYGILKKMGGVSSLQPIIADIWVYEEGGKRCLIALTSNNKWVLQTGASSITVYELR